MTSSLAIDFTLCSVLTAVVADKYGPDTVIRDSAVVVPVAALRDLVRSAGGALVEAKRRRSYLTDCTRDTSTRLSGVVSIDGRTGCMQVQAGRFRSS